MRLVLTSSLLLALLTVTDSHVAIRGSNGVNNNKNSNKKTPRLVVLPLLPGDSPEGRRRRRQRRQRRLQRQLEDEQEELKTNLPEDSTSSEAAVVEKEANNNIDEESPVEMYRDVLYEGYGVHYVDLWVGCPQPQRVTVIVDTGSSVTGFPCQECHRCGGDADSNDEQMLYHTDELFHQDDSTCFEPVKAQDQCLVGQWNKDDKSCRTSRHYSEGSSWDAFEATDQVYTGGDHEDADVQRGTRDSFRLHFGCQDSVTGLFETQLADGIMGMDNSPETFWSQMYIEKKMEQQAFSLCFAEPGHVERKGTLAGAMVLGGTDTRLHRTPMVYATSDSSMNKYKVHLEKVYLQSAASESAIEILPSPLPPSLDISTLSNVQIFEEALNNKGPVIVDSGTTATYLTSQLKRHFEAVFNTLVPEDVMVLGEKKTYELTLRQLQQLPTIVFMIQAAEGNGEDTPTTTTTTPGMVGSDLDPKRAGKSILIRMPPTNYMSRVEDDTEIDVTDLDAVAHYQVNIYFSKGTGRGGVLGANLMRGHDVHFDIDNDRIGFAESTCEYEALADEEESG